MQEPSNAPPAEASIKLEIKNSTKPPLDYEPQLSDLLPQTQTLYRVLKEKSPPLAQMLLGAWLSLKKANNPDYLAQSAHSARELMEKAPNEIPDTPVEQTSGTLKNDVRILSEMWLKTKGDRSSWEGTIDENLKTSLVQLDSFFEKFNRGQQQRAVQLRLTIESLDKTGRTVPPNLLKSQTRLWDKLNSFFQGVSHHGKSTKSPEVEANLIELEDFLLNLLYPQPIPEMEEIDELIAEGEAK